LIFKFKAAPPPKFLFILPVLLKFKLFPELFSYPTLGPEDDYAFFEVWQPAKILLRPLKLCELFSPEEF
jgi:hypothetical protein